MDARFRGNDGRVRNTTPFGRSGDFRTGSKAGMTLQNVSTGHRKT
jgi:hypothetical protein